MEDFDRKEMSTRLGMIRLEKGFSQDSVAEALDVSREIYTQIEGGKRKLKDYEIVQLANFFGVTTDYILRGVASENISISDATGLGDSSVTYLKEVNTERNIPFERYDIHDGGKYARIHQAINIILSQNGDLFLEHLANYLLADTSRVYPIEDGRLHFDSLIDSIGIGAGNDVVKFSVKAVRFGMLREIEEDLEKLRTSLEPNVSSKKRVRRNSNEA